MGKFAAAFVGLCRVRLRVSSLTVLTDSNAILYSYAVFYPVLMLSGAWAVLGPGSYAVRTICSIAVVLTIFLAGAGRFVAPVLMA